MNYIVHKRFKGRAICGDVNLPAGTECESTGELITQGGRILCAVASENAHQHFARNDDGQGLYRGELIRDIQTRLNRRDEQYQERWDKIWDSLLCQKYKRSEYEDYWLWNHGFYNAPISDLEEICTLIGLSVKKRGN